MELKMEKQDWLFLLLCLLLGVAAEEAFFRGQIGVSYLAFIAVFYGLFFWRFRKFSFSHQRFGYLILIVIWLLAASYYLYDINALHILNLLVIPALVIFHLALITAPQKMPWNNLNFIAYALLRLGSGLRYSLLFTGYTGKLLKRGGNPKHYDVWKKVLIGIGISVPFLFVVVSLLVSADAQFERLLGSLPDLLNFNPEYVFRLVVVLLYTFGFFGFMQVLLKKQISVWKKESLLVPISLDGIITLTVLLLLDLVYVLFVAVQFKYFFSGTLEAGYTYAEYARRGFFELVFVTLINLTVTAMVITFAKNVLGWMKKAISLLLTLLVLSSGVLLVSAFMRMSLYEEAYGFTFTRVLVHAFMVFLMVILGYTLVKIWLEKLSLFHFYFIASLMFYAGINIVNIDKIVVDQNLARYEKNGKIDIHYLNSLSSAGVLGLIELYEKNPDVPELKELLVQRKAERRYLAGDSWQSGNLMRNSAYEKLGELEF
jgi:hypothetical protein